ncbi:hypothetical protein MTO96_036126 [Rhipicephalus appendiculatus]
MYHKVATFLWPQFRHLRTLSPEEREEVHTHAKHLMEAFQFPTPCSGSTERPAKILRMEPFSEWCDIDDGAHNRDEHVFWSNATAPGVSRILHRRWVDWNVAEAHFEPFPEGPSCLPHTYTSRAAFAVRPSNILDALQEKGSALSAPNENTANLMNDGADYEAEAIVTLEYHDKICHRVSLILSTAASVGDIAT